MASQMITDPTVREIVAGSRLMIRLVTDSEL